VREDVARTPVQDRLLLRAVRRPRELVEKPIEFDVVAVLADRDAQRSTQLLLGLAG